MEETLKTCTKCKESKPITLEYFYKGNGRDGLTQWCKKCHNINRSNHRIIVKLTGLITKSCVTCNRERLEPFLQCEHCLDKGKETSKNWRAKVKFEVIKAYGGHCSCCNESEIVFLTIDHIEGEGAEHRREIGGGYYFYAMLYRNLKNMIIFPDYQVLCWNCNAAKYINGICPHKVG